MGSSLRVDEHMRGTVVSVVCRVRSEWVANMRGTVLGVQRDDMLKPLCRAMKPLKVQCSAAQPNGWSGVIEAWRGEGVASEEVVGGRSDHDHSA